MSFFKSSFLLFLGMTTIGEFSLAKQTECPAVFSDLVAPVKQGYTEPTIDWQSNHSFIENLKFSETFGVVKTEFSEKYQTQIYFSNLAKYDAKGNLPLVDESCRGVYIFFHGSGTLKSSGRNFIHNMNTLSKFGYCSFSFDMPFHADGPRSEEFKSNTKTLAWLYSIISEIKKYGKEVVLAGHSFGPDVILELVTRFPYLVNKAVPIGVASIDKETDNWQREFTEKMIFGGDVPVNEEGAEFAGSFGAQAVWNKGKLPDPTVVNPNLTIRFLSGALEEYFPAPLSQDLKVIGPNTYDISKPLKKWFKNSIVTIEPGIGHYIFDHADASGTNVVLRELLAVMNLAPSQYKGQLDEVGFERSRDTEMEKLAKRYSQDRLFQSYVNQKIGSKKALRALANHEEKMMTRMYNEYLAEYKTKEAIIYNEIMKLKSDLNALPSPFKEMVQRADPKKVDRVLFFPYLAYLDGHK